MLVCGLDEVHAWVSRGSGMGPRPPSQQRKERGTGTSGRTGLNRAHCVPRPLALPPRARLGSGHPADGARAPAASGPARRTAPGPRPHSLQAVLARAATLLPADLLEDLRKEERRHGRPAALPPSSPHPPRRRGPTWSRTVPGPTRTVTRRPLGANTDTAAPPPPAAAIFPGRGGPAAGRPRADSAPAAPEPSRTGAVGWPCPARPGSAAAEASRRGRVPAWRSRPAAGRAGGSEAGVERLARGGRRAQLPGRRGAGGSGSSPWPAQTVGGSGCSPGIGRGLPPALPAAPGWGRLRSRRRLAAPRGAGGEPVTRPAGADGTCVVPRASSVGISHLLQGNKTFSRCTGTLPVSAGEDPEPRAGPPGHP